jgi:uncharacterized membrane protein
MTSMAERWSDERLEGLLGTVLRWGVVSAAAVVGIGAVVFLVRHGSERPQYHLFRGEPSDLRTVSGILGDALAGRGRGLIQLGLLLLVATPVTRVVLSVGVFALQGDRRYVVITLTVLAVLLYSLFGPYL